PRAAAVDADAHAIGDEAVASGASPGTSAGRPLGASGTRLTRRSHLAQRGSAGIAVALPSEQKLRLVETSTGLRNYASEGDGRGREFEAGSSVPADAIVGIRSGHDLPVAVHATRGSHQLVPHVE